MINSVTRPNSSTCLDHIFLKTEMREEDFSTAVLQCDITDHYPIMLFLRIQSETIARKEGTKKYLNFHKLNNHLASHNWRNVLKERDPNKSTEEFLTVFKQYISESTFERQERKIEMKRKG